MDPDKPIPHAQSRPLVSVIIPTFNASRTISRALKSIQAQPYPRLEVIVADDASTDDTLDQIERLRDPRVSVLRSTVNTNQGPAATRNRALANAKGTYIAFLDSDDEWFPEKVGKQVKFLEANPNCSIVVSNAYDISSESSVIGTEFDSAKKPQKGPEAWRVLLKYSFIETSSVMTRAALIQHIGGFDNRLLVSQDQDLWIRLALAGEVGVLSEVMGSIHKSPTGHMSRNWRRAVDIMLPMIERHVQAQAARLSKIEIDDILGSRYQAVGRNLFAHRQYKTGLKLLFKASLRHGNWLGNIVYVCHANPMGAKFKRIVRSGLRRRDRSRLRQRA